MLLFNHRFEQHAIGANLGSWYNVINGNALDKVRSSRLQSPIMVLSVVLYLFIFPSLFIWHFPFSFSRRLPPRSPSFVKPVRARASLFPRASLSVSAATPPSNHFSWVGLIKGDLTERADHRNISQSLSNTVRPTPPPPPPPPQPSSPPQPAANAHNSAKVNCIHYIRDGAKEGRKGEGE